MQALGIRQGFSSFKKFRVSYFRVSGLRAYDLQEFYGLRLFDGVSDWHLATLESCILYTYKCYPIGP